MDQTTHLVELTNAELEEIIHALEFTAGEGCELNSNIYVLMNKLPDLKPEPK